MDRAASDPSLRRHNKRSSLHYHRFQYPKTRDRPARERTRRRSCQGIQSISTRGMNGSRWSFFFRSRRSLTKYHSIETFRHRFTSYRSTSAAALSEKKPSPPFRRSGAIDVHFPLDEVDLEV